MRREARDTPTPLDPAEAATLFYAGHPLASASDPTDQFVCGQWMGQLAYITRIPFDRDGAEQYFTDNPVVLGGVGTLEPPTTEPPPEPESPDQSRPTVVDTPYAMGPDGSATAEVGETVNVTMGNWEGDPDSYEFQWKRRSGGTTNALPDATTQTYKTTNQDKDKSVFCTIVAINENGPSRPVESNDVVVSKTVDVEQQPARYGRR